MGVWVYELQRNNHEERKISAKITKGNRKYRFLRALMGSKHHSRCMKMRICNTIIKPTVMHESETFVPKKQEEKPDCLERNKIKTYMLK